MHSAGLWGPTPLQGSRLFWVELVHVQWLKLGERGYLLISDPNLALGLKGLNTKEENMIIRIWNDIQKEMNDVI